MRSLVRQAEYKDIPYIAVLYKKALTELGEEYLDDRVENKVRNSFYLAPCFLLENDDKIVGMAGLTVVHAAWSNAVSLADYMFFIEKEHRSLKNLSALVQACKDFALSQNLPLRLEFITGTQEVRERLFKMHGFDKTVVVGVYNG